MIRCKFQCSQVMPVNEGYNVVLNAVYNNRDGSHNEENAQYWKYTPGGTISFYTVNESAAKYFISGKDYYVDFTEAPDGSN